MQTLPLVIICHGLSILIHVCLQFIFLCEILAQLLVYWFIFLIYVLMQGWPISPSQVRVSPDGFSQKYIYLFLCVVMWWTLAIAFMIVRAIPVRQSASYSSLSFYWQAFYCHILWYFKFHINFVMDKMMVYKH